MSLQVTHAAVLTRTHPQNVTGGIDGHGRRLLALITGRRRLQAYRIAVRPDRPRRRGVVRPPARPGDDSIIIDLPGLAAAIPRQRAQIAQDTVVPQKGMVKAMAPIVVAHLGADGARDSHHLTTIVDVRRRRAHSAERAEVERLVAGDAGMRSGIEDDDGIWRLHRIAAPVVVDHRDGHSIPAGDVIRMTNGVPPRNRARHAIRRAVPPPRDHTMGIQIRIAVPDDEVDRRRDNLTGCQLEVVDLRRNVGNRHGGGGRVRGARGISDDDRYEIDAVVEKHDVTVPVAHFDVVGTGFYPHGVVRHPAVRQRIAVGVCRAC